MHKGFLLLALCGCFAFSSVRVASGPPIVPGVSLELAQHRKAVIRDINYNIRLEIPEDRSAAIGAHETVTFRLSDPSVDLQLDFAADPEKIKRVSVNGKAQDVRVVNEHLVIAARHLQAGPNRIEIVFEAGDTSLNRNPEYLYTLFVPDRARTAFPVFDQPNLKATFELTLQVPASWTAVANAALDTMEAQGEQTLYRYKKSDLMSTYLFAFATGKFETVTRTVGGRAMTMLHRESDAEKVSRNLDEIFSLHAASIAWLEDYTGIAFPFQKFDFALIPAFQYGGMEHTGAILYRNSGLFLDEDASDAQLLGRASLIAHETAHMWFGNLVTMDWFNDVWTKEVFANFMAAKIVNPGFPDIDHELNFLVRIVPGAYAVDRTEGANPIRQDLPNLNKAGNLYGGIIYNKAPIMMRQLESLVGEEKFRDGIRDYLSGHAYGNATWPSLVEILDAKTPEDLLAWSDVWINTSGRPDFSIDLQGGVDLRQGDPDGLDRYWPQTFSIATTDDLSNSRLLTFSSDRARLGSKDTVADPAAFLINADGRGYGLFPVSKSILVERWDQLSDVQKASLFIQLYEQLLDHGDAITAVGYVELVKWAIVREENELILTLIAGQVRRVFWSFLTPEQRTNAAPGLENTVWKLLENPEKSPSQKKILFGVFQNIALTKTGIDRMLHLWDKSLQLDGLSLSERDNTNLASALAIRLPGQAKMIIAQQSGAITNPDRQRRFTFIAPALSPDAMERDAFFQTLLAQENREIESWVLDALGYLHHPLRTASAEKYILPSLVVLEEIQQTGDIFFPGRWMAQTLGNYQSPSAAAIVRDFLDKRPDYNRQLRMKILQAADMVFRAAGSIPFLFEQGEIEHVEP